MDADRAPRPTNLKPWRPRGPAVVYLLSEASHECLAVRHQCSQTAKAETEQTMQIFFRGS